jgi:CRP-like cAMP-binding protein
MYSHLSMLASFMEQFEEESGDMYFDLFERKKLYKGEFLYTEGEIPSKFYYIEKGISRSFRIQAGREMTIGFSLPHEFIGHFSSAILNKVSAANTQLLSDAVVYEFDWRKFEKHKSNFEILNQIEKVVLACYISKLEETLFQLQFETAQERYENLLKTRPQVIKKIPLIYIADYLGCSAERISRIRAKLCTVA